MPEEDYRRRTNLHSSHQRPETPKKTTHMGLIRFQLTVCILCIVAAVMIKIVGGSFYTMVRSSVSKALNVQVTSSEIDQAFAAFKNGLPDVNSVFAVSSGKGSSSASSAGNSSGTSSKSSGASSSSSKTTSAAATSSTTNSAAVSSAASTKTA